MEGNYQKEILHGFSPLIVVFGIIDFQDSLRNLVQYWTLVYYLTFIFVSPNPTTG